MADIINDGRLIKDTGEQYVILGGSGTSSSQVQGTAAHDAAVAGNPQVIGGYGSATPPSDVSANGDAVRAWFLLNGALATYMAYRLAGEDITNDVLKIEHRYGYSLVAADTQVKAGAGFLHTLTFSQNDAAPTAGSIIVYDSLTETGTQIFNHTFTTTPFAPFTVTIDASFSTGLFIGFTTTADVNVTVSYR